MKFRRYFAPMLWAPTIALLFPIVGVALPLGMAGSMSLADEILLHLTSKTDPQVLAMLEEMTTNDFSRTIEEELLGEPLQSADRYAISRIIKDSARDANSAAEMTEAPSAILTAFRDWTPAQQLAVFEMIMDSGHLTPEQLDLLPEDLRASTIADQKAAVAAMDSRSQTALVGSLLRTPLTSDQLDALEYSFALNNPEVDGHLDDPTLEAYSSLSATDKVKILKLSVMSDGENLLQALGLLLQS